MELNPLTLVYYHRTLDKATPSDFPQHDIEQTFNPTEPVMTGFKQLWKAVHMRRQLNTLSPPERRSLENDLREEMALLDREKPEESKVWHELLYIHHWSVTADQAEMLASTFARPLI